MASAITILMMAAAAASPPPIPDHYTLLCVPEQTIGFNWVNGGYVEAHFKPQPKIILVDSVSCKPNRSADVTSAEVVWKRVCVNERDLGSQLFPLSTGECLQMQDAITGRWKTNITCRNSKLDFSADPNGIYHMASIHSVTSPDESYKDSQYIEVGKCSVTN